MSLMLLIGVAAFSAVLLMVAALLLLRESDADGVRLARYEAAHGRWAAPPTDVEKASGMVRGAMTMVSAVGRAVMQSGILPGRTRAELQATLSGAGFRGQNVLAVFIGSKLTMLFGLPMAGWMLATSMGSGGLTMGLLTGGSAVAGLIAPDTVIQKMRKRYLLKIERGLSDALDLMVICAQAGLSLEPGMARVAVELRGVHPEMCRELATTVRELEMMSDTSQALGNLGRRTGLDSLQRLTATLTQTLQYGTPLTDSLRTLSNEMRNTALTKFEERAARLPVLLTLPMIAFILPCVFMIVGGPAGIQIGRGLAGG